MLCNMQNQKRSDNRNKARIWLALPVALAIHIVVLLLPIAPQSQTAGEDGTSIELQITSFIPQPADIRLPEPKPQILPPEPEEKAEPELVVEPPKQVQATVTALADETKPPPGNPVARKLKRDFNTMNEMEKNQLTSTILARQYISEESVVDKLFGKPLVQHNTEIRKEFHYPVRPDLISMLDTPMPEVPFAYTPDLVYFAYDPGVKGDLQRFWDVITPEFGWKTRYGTEVRCILVLVIIGCGWK